MKLVVTDSAKVRLKDTVQYYKKHVSDRIADKIRRNIIDALAYVKDNPLKGQVEPLIEHDTYTYRRHVSGNYKTIYRIDGETIYVTDVFDTRQDPEKVFL